MCGSFYVNIHGHGLHNVYIYKIYIIYASHGAGTVRSLPSLIDSGAELRQPNGALIALEEAAAAVLQQAVLARADLVSRPTAHGIGHGSLAESSRSSHDNARAAAAAHNCRCGSTFRLVCRFDW